MAKELPPPAAVLFLEPHSNHEQQQHQYQHFSKRKQSF